MNTWIPFSVSVPEGHVAIAEKFGRFYKLLTPGLNFLPPWCSIKDLSDWANQATQKNRLMEITQQQMETISQKCSTKDHVTVHSSIMVRYCITQPIRAAYQVDVLPEAINDVCTKALRSRISNINLDDVFTKRQIISQNVMNDVAAKVNQWGVRLLGVEVGELHFDPAIETAMQQKRMAQAEFEKKTIEAQTQRMQAESDAKSLLIRSQAEANGRKMVADADMEYINKLVGQLGNVGAIDVLKATKAADALAAVASNPGAKTIMIPNDFKGMLKLVDGQVK
jgi:regulator of protease activity HflC (stomatin/prohibitin superfamily)